LTRSQGFLIELAFRNAPPRPPVGPCFVGLGLDGELNDQMTKYKSNNAVEANYSWKLHAEPDLGVPLAPSAMDYEGCYVDPSAMKKKQKRNDEFDEDLFDDEENHEKGGGLGNDGENGMHLIPLHPDDDALLNWNGHIGDSAAEELQRLRDKARAEARLGMKGMKLGGSASGKNGIPSTLLTKQGTPFAKRNNKDFKSRVLDEVNPFFMKKTTYLANDHNQRVHDFKSLAQSKAEKEEEIEKKLSTKKALDKNVIEQSFVSVHQKTMPTTTGKRKHPSKENVEAEYEIPLLPDDETWGHSFIHVVLDNLPKDESLAKILTNEKLERAYIGDVNKGAHSQRMECNLLLATDDDDDDDDATTSENEKYSIVHKYDLDVIPLKEEDKPHNNFLFVIDEEKGIATYHPISSRVQLSTGRPSDEIGSRKITKRPLDDYEIIEMEERLAEVDADMADKYKKDEDKEEKITQQPKSFYPFAGNDSSSDEDE
jgi:hypothetical protein